jgi:hypothetical protein
MALRIESGLFVNRIPDSVREQIVEVALQRPDLTPRELAWHRRHQLRDGGKPTPSVAPKKKPASQPAY